MTTTTTLTITITTTYRGPTNNCGSRITAKAAGRGLQVSVPYDYALDAFNNHAAAAQALATLLCCTGALRSVPAPRLVKGYRFEVTA